MKFVVVENEPGYLPESDPEVYDTEDEAQQRLKDIRNEWLDLGWDPFGITGSYREGWYRYGTARIAEIIPMPDELAMIYLGEGGGDVENPA